MELYNYEITCTSDLVVDNSSQYLFTPSYLSFHYFKAVEDHLQTTCKIRMSTSEREAQQF